MPKILVVDDERPIAEIIKYNLQKEGFEVRTAYDGDEAIKAVHQFQPELIILDIMLPKKSGFDVLKEIRMEYVMPVIMLTAKEEENDLREYNKKMDLAIKYLTEFAGNDVEKFEKIILHMNKTFKTEYKGFNQFKLEELESYIEALKKKGGK